MDLSPKRYEHPVRCMIAGRCALFGAMVFGAQCASAAPLSAVPEGVERYARAVDVAIKSPTPVSLEAVFEDGISAANALKRNQLEQLDEPTYQKVRSMMAGFSVSREEVVVAAPAADYFLKLARAKGTSVDRAFFEALKKTYPVGAWPAYQSAQTDFGGCTVFDGKTLSGIYDAWISFQKANPGRYTRAVNEELSGIRAALGSTCACGGVDGYQKELDGFLAAYPDSPIAKQVASRLQASRNHKSDVQFHCKAQ